MNAVIYIHGKGGSAVESGKFNVGRKFVWNRCKKYNVEKKIKGRTERGHKGNLSYTYNRKNATVICQLSAKATQTTTQTRLQLTHRQTTSFSVTNYQFLSGKDSVALRCYTATLGNPVRAGNRKKSHAYIYSNFIYNILYIKYNKEI